METANTSSRHSRGGGNPVHFGFTLVELIVVITILVILGTIAFLNLGSFSGAARDGTRVSDLANISKGLDIVYVKNGRVPTPDASMVTITASWTAIGYQWYAGGSVLGQIKMGEAKDPLDKKYYTYLVNSDYTKYQLLGLLEDSSTITTSLVPSVYAGYETRIPSTKGSSLGVLLGNTGSIMNQPVQELLSGNLELSSSTGGLYQAYVSKTQIISATGAALGWLTGIYNVKSAGSTYPGCDTKDILLPNGQVWAACNVGASRAYQGETVTNCNNSTTDCNTNIRYTLGSNFQWGRNEDVTSLGTGSTAPGGTLASATLWYFALAGGQNDWINTQNHNLWWGLGTTSTWWTFLSQGSPTDMQGPCASGYHIPTQYEWWLAASTINPAITNTGSAQNDTSVMNLLKLPLAWRRYAGDGKYINLGTFWFYRTSSPIDTNCYSILVNSKQIILWASDYRASANNIRCIKN